MSLQLSISFEVTHKRENNPLSEEHLNAHRDKFNHDCYEVFKALVNGKRLTVKDAIVSGLSGDLRRRIKDLKDEGYSISEVWIGTGKSKVKEWFMTAGDKAKSLTVLLGKSTIKKVA